MKRALATLLIVCAIANASATDYLTQLWQFDTRAPSEKVYLLNSDSGPEKEILVGSYESGVVFALAANGSKLWEFHIKGRMFGFHAAEVPLNTGEVAMGTWSRAVSLNADGNKSWQYFISRYEIRSVYVDDLNNDGRAETALGILGGWRGNTVTLADSIGEVICKATIPKTGYPYSITSLDINSDGKKEMIVGLAAYTVNTVAESYSLGFTRPSTLTAYNINCEQLWEAPTPGGVKSLAVGDINNDGASELLAGANSYLIAYLGNGKQLWDYSADGEINDIAVGDLNGDGLNDIVVGAGSLHVLNSSGSLLWRSGKLSSANSIVIRDLDFDDKPEIIVGASKLYIFDWMGNIIYTSTVPSEVYSVKAEDVTGDDYVEIAASSKDDQLRLYATKPYVEEHRAETLYKKAESVYENRNYSQVGEYAEQARKVYDELGDADGSTKAKLLAEKALDHMDADNYTMIARGYYDMGDYENASGYSQKALEIYKQLDDIRAINEMTRLSKASDVTPDAEGNLSMARQYYDSRDFENAKTYARTAFSLYTMINDANMSNTSKKLIDDIELQSEAKKNYDEAMFYYDEKAYDTTREYLNTAGEIYESLGDAYGMKLVEDASKKLSRTKTLGAVMFYGSIIAGLVIILLLIAAVFLVGMMLGGGSKRPELKKIEAYATKLNLMGRLDNIRGRKEVRKREKGRKKNLSGI
ncbi:MAG: VCBS repeat-containing protein [Candidatus Altiarchaeota archaeon]